MTKCSSTPMPYVIKQPCPVCPFPLYIDRSTKVVKKCNACDEFKELVRCRNTECAFKSEICLQCLAPRPSQQPRQDDEKNSLSYILITAVVVLVGVLLYLRYSPNSESLPSKSLIGRLRERFPSQKNETWYHILSVLEQKVPTVKSITLLYKNDRKTPDCLAKELVGIFSKNVKIEDVSFDVDRIEYKDYGEVLEHYHAVVKTSRVLVTNLSAVPAEVARVFHSLCDEVSSDIKPSLFIFFLRWDDERGNLKPLEMATAILKQAWRDLPSSDIFPLLSRVIKNVVDVLPEKHIICE